jgi:glycosyltransferase involved in cell wall biosynthesis
MTRTQVTLLTVGDPQRVTGGYLFHRRLADRAQRLGADVTFVSIPDLPLAWAIATGPRWLRTAAMRTADVLVLDSIAAAPAAPWLGRIAAPVVGMLHQPLGGMDAHRLGRAVRVPFDRRAYRACSVLMVASDWLAQQLAGAGLERARLRVVPPGKDLDAVGSRARDVEPNQGAAFRNGRLIAALCVANWLPRKGVLELLDAVARLPDEVVTLHLVGDTATQGRYADAVRERIKSGELRDRVVVHGVIPPQAVERMYRTVDVFVLPSFEEPYGTVWGEAMAAGLPVIGWRAGNLPFLADHGTEGLLAPVGDVPTLASFIDRTARDATLRASMAGAAARRAEARPTWDATAERFFTIIDEVLTAHRGPGRTVPRGR